MVSVTAVVDVGGSGGDVSGGDVAGGDVGGGSVVTGCVVVGGSVAGGVVVVGDAVVVVVAAVVTGRVVTGGAVVVDEIVPGRVVTGADVVDVVEVDPTGTGEPGSWVVTVRVPPAVGFTNAPRVPPMVPGVAAVVVVGSVAGATAVDGAGAVDVATPVDGDVETAGVVAVGDAACVPAIGWDPSADAVGALDATIGSPLDADTLGTTVSPVDIHTTAVQINAGRAATPIAVAGRSGRPRAEPGSSNMSSCYPRRPRFSPAAM